MEELAPGLVGEVEMVVTEADTAARLGSGTVPVFATPALVGLMESAAVRALTDHLSPGWTSVGGWIDVRHLAATPVGMRVRARAELLEAEGHRLVFHIEAWDVLERIGEATHERFVVDEARFVAKAEAKKAGG
jgi:fluoroacetyl-CoA thioesterase